jgi:hypothetical protein
VTASCSGRQLEPNEFQVQIKVDQEIIDLSLPLGSTVSDAIKEADIELNFNDKVEPPGQTIITDGMEIIITRVSERSETVHVVLPFEKQIVKNESIPDGETHLLQPGENGLEEIIYRIIEEDGSEKTRIISSRVVLEEPVPEIMMVGTQKGYTPLTFPGKIVYVSTQNTWLIDGETGTRRLIISTGDLDGRILEVSPDGRWLLFSRKFDDMEEGINSLWLLDLADPSAEPKDLDVQNIIHFADWSPQSPTSDSDYVIAFSTVEPRSAAPGWQANNDLQILEFDYEGTVISRGTILETNSGGQYGWWGTNFAWSPDAEVIAYSRANSIGLVDLDDGTLLDLVAITPYQTQADWAWLPPISWGPNSEIIYYVAHGEPIGLENPEASQVFDTMAFYLKGSKMGPLVHRSGMFSFIAISPQGSDTYGARPQTLAILQSIEPLESETSRYRIVVMDRDGSNQTSVFPSVGELGLEPGKIIWAPNGNQIATLYQGNLWVIDTNLGLSQRMTADGQTIAFDWSP